MGESTVLNLLADTEGVEVIDLDDVETREAVVGNLASVTAAPTPLCIDEHQRVPDVLDAIKARLNREGSRPGVAVITGSTRQDALPTTAQALTGAAEAHLRLLEDLFLVVRLPAWGKTLRSRVSARPKFHVVDSGLAARLLRLTPAKLATLDPAALTKFGNLLEIFVVGEIRKQVSWLDEPVTLGHWRTSDGAEVDLVVECDDGGVLAFEVKANERATGRDFAGLEQLRDALGARFCAGVVFTTGRSSFTYADRIHVMPIDRLWRTINIPAPTSP